MLSIVRVAVDGRLVVACYSIDYILGDAVVAGKAQSINCFVLQERFHQCVFECVLCVCVCVRVGGGGVEGVMRAFVLLRH